MLTSQVNRDVLKTVNAKYSKSFHDKKSGQFNSLREGIYSEIV